MTNDPRAQSEQPNSEPSRLENVKWPVSLADWLTIRAEIARLNARANHYGYCNLHGHHLGYECPECPYEAAIAATRAERDALAALVDEVIRDSTPPRPNSSVVFHFKAWLSRAKALRAPQTGGANDGQT